MILLLRLSIITFIRMDIGSLTELFKYFNGYDNSNTIKGFPLLSWTDKKSNG